MLGRMRSRSDALLRLNVQNGVISPASGSRHSHRITAGSPSGGKVAHFQWVAPCEFPDKATRRGRYSGQADKNSQSVTWAAADVPTAHRSGQGASIQAAGTF
jgi:hypothetical protein